VNVDTDATIPYFSNAEKRTVNGTNRYNCYGLLGGCHGILDCIRFLGQTSEGTTAIIWQVAVLGANRSGCDAA
jgi:hypothetical protein